MDKIGVSLGDHFWRTITEIPLAPVALEESNDIIMLNKDVNPFQYLSVTKINFPCTFINIQCKDVN